MSTRTAFLDTSSSYSSRKNYAPKQEDQTSKLIHAIEDGNASVLQKLLRAGTDPNSRVDIFRTCPMHVAAGLEGQIVTWMLSQMLAHGGNPNIQNADGITPLHVSCIENRVENLRLLMEHDGDLTLQCNEGYNALGYARKYHATECIKFIDPSSSMLRTPSSASGKGTGATSARENPNSNLSGLSGKNLQRNLSGSSNASSQYFSCASSPDPETRQAPRLSSGLKNVPSRASADVDTDSMACDSPVFRGKTSAVRRSSSGTRETTRSRSATRYVPGSSSESDDDHPVPTRPHSTSRSTGTPRTAARWASEQSVIPGVKPILKSSRFSENFVPPENENRNRCRRISGKVNVTPVESEDENARDEYAQYAKVTDAGIRQELRELGMEPGPITTSMCRFAYIKKLIALKRDRENNLLSSSDLQDSFCRELNLFISGGYDRQLLAELETEFIGAFNMTRSVSLKQHFTYLLLDPRISQNISYQVKEGSDANMMLCFRMFLRAIFYVGKGTNARPLDHLVKAKTLYQSFQKTQMLSKQKIVRICSIWDNDYGVVVLPCFHNLSAEEAFTRESLMIEALGIEKLTNERRGSAYESPAAWSGHRKRFLGGSFLARAFRILINEGERQIFPRDVKG